MSARGKPHHRAAHGKHSVRPSHLLLAVTTAIAATTHAGACARAGSGVAGAGAIALLGLPGSVLQERSMQSKADPMAVQCSNNAIWAIYQSFTSPAHQCIPFDTRFKQHLTAVPSFPASEHGRITGNNVGMH